MYRTKPSITNLIIIYLNYLTITLRGASSSSSDLISPRPNKADLIFLHSTTTTNNNQENRTSILFESVSRLEPVGHRSAVLASHRTSSIHPPATRPSPPTSVAAAPPPPPPPVNGEGCQEENEMGPADDGSTSRERSRCTF